MNNKKLIPCIYLNSQETIPLTSENPIELAAFYGNNGADELLVVDLSTTDAEHDAAISCIKEMVAASQIPVIGMGNIKRMEDVKKLLYAGCQKVALDFSITVQADLLEEVSKKFGKEKMVVAMTEFSQFSSRQEAVAAYADTLLTSPSAVAQLSRIWQGDLWVNHTTLLEEEALSLLQKEEITGLTGAFVSNTESSLLSFKNHCKQNGIAIQTFESKVSWAKFQLNQDGMVPVIVQDYKTNEVLMLAYMNEEAFETTLNTGKMTYWSRSRNELWTKGLTSGHIQYVKSLTMDCDWDTMLAKVSQVGAACHTGNRSCFFHELAAKEYDNTNPLKVFEDVFAVILDRKEHPKEGSYTNYLFDKGLDKILKKVGEECTEIVIAAKNPDKEEIKYEISDFLYHVMVLMAEKNVTWEEITRELARR